VRGLPQGGQALQRCSLVGATDPAAEGRNEQVNWNPYHLSGPGMSPGERILEFVFQTIAIIVVAPLVLVYRGLSWLMERVLP
jgi:hypothetical protein